MSTHQSSRHRLQFPLYGWSHAHSMEQQTNKSLSLSVTKYPLNSNGLRTTRVTHYKTLCALVTRSYPQMLNTKS